MPAEPLPWPIRPAPDPVDPTLEPLLDEPVASAFAAADETTPAAPPGLRGRLLARAAVSGERSRGMLTTRAAPRDMRRPATDVGVRMLYEAPSDRPLRPGEPLRVRVVELPPGAAWAGPDTRLHREWLVLGGSLRLGGEALGPRDYHVVPAGAPAHDAVASAEGARVFLRESAIVAAPGDRPCTVRDAEAGWPAYAPGICRRVLWQRDGEAALLYHARAGAAVPAHTHGHDEECLMVEGELFLDDLLLRQGDYQLAPAGSGHATTATDTGVVIYAHGDLDLKFVA